MDRASIQIALAAVLEPHGFVALASREPDPETMGGWSFEYQSEEFRVFVSQDRTDDAICICVGSLIRRALGKQMRGPWSLSHVRGYLDGSPAHHVFGCVEDQIGWLRENIPEILQTSLLNSDGLNRWSVNVSRRMF